MLFKSALFKIDKILCAYFGINETEKVSLNEVKLIKNKLFVFNSPAFTRHSAKESWESFSKRAVRQIDSEDKQKLGLALGKAIAAELVISFEETPINRK